MIEVVGEADLEAFRRQHLDGRRLLDALAEGRGALHVATQVGTGKSHALDAVTLEAFAAGYDQVVVVAPTRRLLRERLHRRHRPPGRRVVEIRPRPARRCGPERDARWRRREGAGLAALGRFEICGGCPQRPRCFWPDQYGEGLKGAEIVYAPQAHLVRAPDFLAQVRDASGSLRPLTLIDEADVAGRDLERAIEHSDQRRFVDVLKAATPRCGRPEWEHDAWLELAELLLGASTDDLQADDWRAPRVRADWAAVVQGVGVERYGDDFRFPGHAVAELVRSPIETRRRAPSCAIEYAARPNLGHVILFSATSGRGYASYRLGVELASPLEGVRFRNPGTRWYNLASPIGTRGFFPGHAPQILDFVAGLTARRAAEGRRVLLVSKKQFVPACAAGLSARFRELGAGLRVVHSNWSSAALADPGVVALIWYGMNGVNDFEHFDCVYCLNGYYVNERVIDRCLQDVVRGDLRLGLKIETTGQPRRRRARVADPADVVYDVARLAQEALEFKEHGTVVQAVGRARPFTRPREVLTFQMAELPGVRYDAEFDSLAAARRFFGIPSRRERRRDERGGRVARVLELRREGLTQAQVAAALGVSERTVRNLEKEGRKQPIS